MKDSNGALEARLSELEVTCRLVEEEKRACSEERSNQVRVAITSVSFLIQILQILMLESSHGQAIEAVKLDFEERLHESRESYDAKVRFQSQYRIY